MARNLICARLLKLGLIAIMLTLVIVAPSRTSASPSSQASTPCLLPASTFEIDGDLAPNKTGCGVDWQAFQGSSALKIGTEAFTGQKDDSLGQGAKEDDPAPSVVTGSIPGNKSDLTRFYLLTDRSGSPSQKFIYLAWERASTLGSANIDFEFNQAITKSSNNVTPVRTDGDMLVTFDFSGGGTTATLGVLRWLGVGGTAGSCYSSSARPCWGNRVDLSATGNAMGAINSTTVTDPLNGNGSLPDATFGEAAINLTALFSAGVCVDFGSAYVKSRSSASFTAELKDFIAPVAVQVSPCPSVTIVKQTLPSTDTTAFSYTATGSSPFSLSNGQSKVLKDLLPGTYEIVETVPTESGTVIYDVAVTGGSACVLNNSDPVHPKVTVTLTSASPDVTCTFVNSKRGKIVVDKVTNPSGDPTSFAFTLTGGPSAVNEAFALTDAAAPRTSGWLKSNAGANDPAYVVAETAQAGWQTSATCSSSASPSTPMSPTLIKWGPGETVTCTFTNTRLYTVLVVVCNGASSPAVVNGQVALDNGTAQETLPSGLADTAATALCQATANSNTVAGAAEFYGVSDLPNNGTHTITVDVRK
jgi:hypothetical protein